MMPKSGILYPAQGLGGRGEYYPNNRRYVAIGSSEISGTDELGGFFRVRRIIIGVHLIFPKQNKLRGKFEF
jgi:hypothetical protein